MLMGEKKNSNVSFIINWLVIFLYIFDVNALETHPTHTQHMIRLEILCNSISIHGKCIDDAKVHSCVPMCTTVYVRVNRSAQAFRIAIKIYNRNKTSRTTKNLGGVCCVCWINKQRRWFWLYFENLNLISKKIRKFEQKPAPNVLQRVFSPQTYTRRLSIQMQFKYNVNIYHIGQPHLWKSTSNETLAQS